jgi:hypothetical protein
LKTLMILAISTVLLGCSNMIKSGAIVEAQYAINDGDYSKALETSVIAESFGKLSPADTAKLHYLRGRSLEGLGRKEEAVHSYQYVVEQHKNSAYAGLSQQRLDVL